VGRRRGELLRDRDRDLDLDLDLDRDRDRWPPFPMAPSVRVLVS
jgi:hypothetical protein